MSDLAVVTRADIVAAARGFVDTKWGHRGRTPGVALDCAGVLVCAARAVGIVAPDWDVPEYSGLPDGTLMPWMARYMGQRQSVESMRAGDAIVVATDEDPQHLGILDEYRHGWFSIIHASNSPSVVPQRVIKPRLMFTRNFRFVAAFSFPGIA